MPLKKYIRDPLVTVMMAVYNGEKIIKPTIESILKQSVKDFEFVIVNDGSTDTTAEIIKSYKDARIILHNNHCNLGQTKSLNVGLHIARGKYIARTDAGDISLPLRLERQVNYMHNNPGIAVLGTAAFLYNPMGKNIRVAHMPDSRTSILRRSIFTSPVIHVSVLMNREIILHHGGYDEDYHITADYELWSRLLRNNYSIANINEILVGYMVSPESFGASNALTKSIFEAPLIIQNNVKKFANITISLDQAKNIYRVVNHLMEGLTLTQVIESEHTLAVTLKAIGTPKSEINYVLLNKDLKCLYLRKKRAVDNLIIRHCMRSLLCRSNCFLSLRILQTVATQLYYDINWRFKKQCYCIS